MESTTAPAMSLLVKLNQAPHFRKRGAVDLRAPERYAWDGSDNAAWGGGYRPRKRESGCDRVKLADGSRYITRLAHGDAFQQARSDLLLGGTFGLSAQTAHSPPGFGAFTYLATVPAKRDLSMSAPRLQKEEDVEAFVAAI
ncbi:hypothetical protein P3T76_012675 [Phytophthora citrophthora]|uniref:Uncharacterized protein n=1 Tax=Phytophthora citrophthora TaxID=4793 RepID=A0AAD9G4M1_9STRA|nr:hypothetical protein P3T76_012675 [Phytophthora citrophthora]